MYYLRTRPAANAIQFTVDQGVIQQVKDTKQNILPSNGLKENGFEEKDVTSNGLKEKYDREQAMACSLDNKEACIMCSA